MIKIVNNILPFKGYCVMTVWPLQFIRKGEVITKTTERHEGTHALQQREMFVVGVISGFILFTLGCGWWSLLALPLFYWWYAVEWLTRLCIYRNKLKAYRNIAFEREARINSYRKTYNKARCSFAWVDYILDSKNEVV